MIQQGTDWNRHHGVGATLLENWVEERAVGDIVLEERSDLSKLSRTGHNVRKIMRRVAINWEYMVTLIHVRRGETRLEMMEPRFIYTSILLDI